MPATTEFDAVLNVADLNGDNGFTLLGNGTLPSGAFGYYVGSSVTAGDVDGDGFVDVLCGAAQYGEVFVAHGLSTGFPNFTDLTFTGGVFAYGQLGTSVAFLGDVNGDGIGDWIGGAPSASYSAFVAGSAFLSVSGSGISRLDGMASGDMAGWSVGAAGDINGDGLADFMVGAFRVGGLSQGQVYVVFGSHDPSDFGLAGRDGNNGFTISGSSNQEIGNSVAAAGDVNGDGLDDIIVGTRGSGTAYIVYGTDQGFAADISTASLDGNNGSAIAGGSSFGFSVSGAGDVNADGIADVIVAAPGKAYVLFGQAGGFGANFNITSLDGSNGFALTGLANGVSANCVSAAGDVNGDGFGDVIVGSPYANSSAGAAYVLFGQAGGFNPSIDVSTLDGNNGFRIDPAGHDTLGFSVHGGVDINGDGFDDIMIGAPAKQVSYDLFGTTYYKTSGAVYVIYGHAPDIAVTREGTGIANTIHGSAFNDTLSGVGDDDILMGGAGNDVMDGGDGSDTASYADAPAGVTASLAYHNVAHNMGGGQGRDTLSSIENLTGSKYADTLTGDGGNNVLTGLAGDDNLLGAAGDDTMVGGAGNDNLSGRAGSDTADYSGATGSITVNLGSSPQDVGGGQGIDTLSAIENLTGSNYADALTGNSRINVLVGLDGNDTLRAGGGNDIVTGGHGADDLYGASGADIFVYSEVADSMHTSYDRITGFDLLADTFDLWFSVTGIDASRTATSFSRIGAAFNASHLGAYHAGLVDVGSHTFLVVDANGVAGYQAGADLIVRVDGVTGTLDTGDFT